MKVLRSSGGARWLAAAALLRGGGAVVIAVSGVTRHGRADVAGRAGRRPRLHLRPAVRHGVQRRVPRVGRGRAAHGRELSVERAVDGQRVAGVLPALEGPAHRQEDDDERSRSSRPSRDHYFRRMPEQRTNPNYSFDPNYRWDSDDAEVTIPGAACAGRARAARRASRRHAGQPDDRRRGQQPAELDQRRLRLRRGAPDPHAQQRRQRRRLRRHLGRRADDGRVPGAPALVQRERHRTRRRRSRSRCSTRRPAAPRTARTSARARSTTRTT